MWDINDTILTLPEHSIMYADEYERKLERSRERHQMKRLLAQLYFIDTSDEEDIGELTER